MDKEDYFIPPNHTGFKARPLLSAEKESKLELSLAYIEPSGGGPLPDHTHEHDHIFYVIRGEARIYLGGKWIILKEDESIHVPGKEIHSVWNNGDSELKMIGINVY